MAHMDKAVYYTLNFNRLSLQIISSYRNCPRIKLWKTLYYSIYIRSN